MRELEGSSDSQFLQKAARAAVQLASLEGLGVPSWSELAAGARPPLRNTEGLEPGTHCGGRQHEAAARAEWQFRTQDLMPRAAEHERALLRSQSGPAAGMCFFKSSGED